ncbi:S8 family peptidase [Sporichthya polymorpha]|uniref:S8 family peptidase n=1 Tax=Sporichthya polymorpha TaxID=35751 RepID=UPI0003815363|nr:S8 family peptidase [Sporichthya polymorpha]
MTTEHPEAPRRPLLVNGEGLKVDVAAPASGGGPKFEPRTAEDARSFLLPQISAAVQDAHRLPQTLRAADRLYVEAKLVPNYLAASYFPAPLLAHIGATPVGSRADTGDYQTRSRSETVQTRRLIFTVSDDGLSELETLVNTRGQGRTQAQAFSEIRKLDEVSLPTVAQVLRAPEATTTEESREARTWEAVLHPLTARAGEAVPLDDETLQRWFTLIESRNGRVHADFVRRVGGLTFTPVTLPTDDDVVALARFNPLRVLRPMPAIRPRPSFGTRSALRVAPPAATSPVSATVKVAVFDGGVDVKSPSPLFPISASDLTSEPADADELNHGTGVTGAVLYGLLTPGQQAPQPPLPVESFRVLPAPNIPGDLEGYWVLDRIKETVEQGGHKLVNLSLGPTLAVEDDMEPNRWTSELDQLAWDNDVLFVVAAGNDGEEDRAAGLHRVQVPADMANGLAVGACDAPAPDKPWSRAPYSSMGPGRQGGRVQPLGVQFGGVDGRLFNVLRSDGTFLEASGTSFAAPLTTHALADLVTRLPRVNSSVLRAFVTHFAERPRQHVKLRDEVGYGRQVLSFVDTLECSPDEVHVLIVDEIERNDLLGYQVPVPAVVSSDLQLRMTLAYASPIDPTQPTEYTSASLEILLRPHQSIHSFRPPAGLDAKSEQHDLRSNEALTLMAAGWTPSQEPVTKSLGAPKGSAEVQLRDSGKWETIRHHRVILKATETERPRLELSYIARRAGALDNAPTKVPFALLVSITDNSGGGTLYDAVRSEHRALLPADRPRARIRTRGGQTAHWD